MSNSRQKLATLLSLCALCFVCTAQAIAAGGLVKLRINTMHGFENAQGAVLDAGLNLKTEVSVSASSPFNGTPFLPPDKFADDARSVGATILSSSFSNWDFSYDSEGYQKLTNYGMVHVFAYEPRQPQPWNAPPPASFVTVNKIGAQSNGGIEFGVPSTYMHGKGQSNSPSGVTAQLAGLMACLKFSHPTWNWFDIKAALRATASNFSTGYDPKNYGYGSIDYYAANALKDAWKLPLFAPAAVLLQQRGDQLTFVLNGFRQSRRYTEVLFAFSARPPLQHKELTLAEITALGGQRIFSNLRADANLVSLQVVGDEMTYLAWFTEDVRGNFSRLEPYSIIGPLHQ